AIAAMPEIGPALAPWVDVGEAGGCLPQMLEAAAKRQGALAARLLSTGLALLGPSLLVAVGAFVLALSLALLVPVLRLSTAAQPVF
ncbi:MAG: type II secretion system F family protein, partial [Kiritimatiellae bacterium]|nr:type II secretion system F family protein [Kiritimatiellia bacterium]